MGAFELGNNFALLTNLVTHAFNLRFYFYQALFKDAAISRSFHIPQR